MAEDTGQIIEDLPNESLPPGANIYGYSVTDEECPFSDDQDWSVGSDRFVRWPRGLFAEKFDYLSFSRAGFMTSTLVFCLFIIPLVQAAIFRTDTAVTALSQSPFIGGAMIVSAAIFTTRYLARARNLWVTVMVYETHPGGNKHHIYYARQPTRLGRVVQAVYRRILG